MRTEFVFRLILINSWCSSLWTFFDIPVFILQYQINYFIFIAI